ncbi:restriction endonuclease [Orenia marismortui]|uniref:restriction endonuclease n=1 Tax=Orenia marismortui TaxID=46469 RepID=UPI000367D35B|nr:restriction endonuclease [Orenia marismortui]
MPRAIYPTYEIEISHNGLNKYKIIKGKTKREAQRKANAQLARWDEQWQKKLEKEEKRQRKELKKLDQERKSEIAKEKTEKAQKLKASLENMLVNSLKIDNSINWDKLKDESKFEKRKPKKARLKSLPPKPVGEPKREYYKPKINLLDKLFKKRKIKKQQISNNQYNKALERHKKDIKSWKERKNKIIKENEKIEKEYETSLKKWDYNKQEFYKKQEEYNQYIINLEKAYFNKVPSAIAEYYDIVLDNVKYPDIFPQEFEIDYNPDNNILLLDYRLPSHEDLPKIQEVKYIKTRDSFKEKELSKTAFRKLYDGILYQIALKTINDIYQTDEIDIIDAIVFNGFVRTIDKATGKKISPCVLSIQVTKKEFHEINLDLVDPKECFKNLKGVGASRLYKLSPVAPIIKIDKEDSRFIESYDVSDNLNDADNLAAMDWQDFEHLIREIFEKEFSQTGGEVKVTQSSRDGGVDAIAFDPDPIRGGKIVIQAKRYTNVVGVSAVRDLYGTVVNEGATKGILVTTSNYGADSHNFAKDKPITLLNGSNLLHLLEKHGYKAKIDLKEAKRINSSR